ncbi:MAG: hypothetical protein ACLQVI_32530 [Polyangiaceae bacterium]|jgi:hypothetical protein
MRSLSFVAVVALALGVPACSTYSDDLARSQHAFEENQHETALAIQRMLELDTSHLDSTEQARYAYLRGMTDFRIGYKADARHWLAVAKAMDEKTPGIIPADWRTRLDQSLSELDSQVWTAGMESLASTPDKKRSGGASKHPAKKQEVAAPPSDEEEEEESPKPAPKKKKPVDDDE